MVARPHEPLRAVRAIALLAVIALVAGCGSSANSTTTAAVAPGTCAQTVVRTLGGVLKRIYHEGVESERTGAARHIIENSAPLREAIEAGNPGAVSLAAQALVAEGHITNLRVSSGPRTLADVGSAALTPLRGTIRSAAGVVLATYRTSVWSDRGFVAEGSGVTESEIVIRKGARSLGGTLPLGRSNLPAEGALALHGAAYQYFSFAGEAYPAGAVRIFLLRPASSIGALCGATPEETLVNTLSHIATLIYAGEIGSRSRVQVRRVEHDSALIRAVARRDPIATRAAVIALLNQHIVRLRVEAQGKLLSDVGGPDVLGPVGGPLRSGGRRIGSFLLSIQDDEGYKRLAGRLAGLKVLMYMGAEQRLVKNSLGPGPGSVPASGPYSYRGQSFRVYTLEATAFPTGPLTIRVLIPIPYS